MKCRFNETVPTRTRFCAWQDEKWIEDADLSYVTNESYGYAWKRFALEGKKGGGEVVVCTPARPCAIDIKAALARGADRAISHRLDERIRFRVRLRKRWRHGS